MSAWDAAIHPVDAVILTAIRSEFDAVLAVDAGAADGSAWTLASSPNGLPVAFRSFAVERGPPLRIAAAVSADLGAIAALHALLPLVEALRPRCVAMCGVCAGRRGKAQLGDVVAADRLFFHDTGKQLPDRVQQDLMTYQLRDDWKAALEGLDAAAQFRDAAWLQRRPLTTQWRERRALIALRDGVPEPWNAVEPGLAADAWKQIIDELRAKKLMASTGSALTRKGQHAAEDLLFEHQGALPDLSPSGAFQPFRLHVAPMGSGARVIEDEAIWGFVSTAMRRTLGIDMEAAVLGELAHRERQHRLDVVVMKGVMDFADHGRDDHFKDFAARASAECLLWFLRQHVATERTQGAGDLHTPSTSPAGTSPAAPFSMESATPPARSSGTPSATSFATPSGAPSAMSSTTPPVMTSATNAARSAAIASDRLDYRIERQRHEAFVGRTALLAQLDRWLVDDDTDRWVVVTGGPGMGKSAILAAWLARREATGAIVPHHFIRRGEYRWDDPDTLVGSLVAQIEARFPDQREPAEDAAMHPAARLAAMLTRVSAAELVPRGERLVLLIDGLDEYDPPAGAPGDALAALPPRDPLAAFLPHALPRGVRFLCASRPRHPYLPMLEARDGEHASIDLDDGEQAADNAATVRTFWEGVAPALGLEARFVDEAVACADGNLQHAVLLRKHLKGLPDEQRRVQTLPRGLDALLVKVWRRIETDPIAVHGLGILCAAREALTLDELGAIAGWTGAVQRQRFVHAAREFLVETRRADGQPAYRLHHDSIRAHIMRQLGPAAVRGHHAAVADKLATWPTPADAAARRYAFRHALAHRGEAGDWPAVGQLACDLGFLEAKCRELGVHEVEADLTRAAERCRAHGDDAVARYLGDLSRATTRESHWLRDEPAVLTAQLWNRLRRMGWSNDELDQRLRLPKGVAAFVCVRHAASRESPVLLRDLVEYSDGVNACAVTPDGRHVVSAYDDRTLKVWDLATGRAVTRLEVHAGSVKGCAVTPDGQRVVSASGDGTLKVWDLTTGRAITRLEAHAGSVNSCVVTPDGQRVVSASEDRTLKVWDLTTGRVVTTFEGHAREVNGCAVTPDGQRVVSASNDGTLKVWDLRIGRVITTLEGHTGWVRSCAVTPDGQRVVSASGDKTLKIWDLHTGRMVTTLKGHTAAVMSCAITADGQRVVSTSGDKTLKVWDLEIGCVVTTLKGHTDWVNSCAITPDGQRVVSASSDGTMKVWDLTTGRVVPTLEGHTGRVRGCAVTLDGQRMVSASNDGTLKVWDLATGRVVTTLEGNPVWVNSCAITPDGQRVVSASGDKTLKVWDLATGRVVTTLEGHTAEVNSCAVTLDGERVVSASDDRTLKVWDLEAGRVVTTLEGHTGWVRSCAVTPDGQCVVSASDDRTLNVWDLVAGVVTTLEGHTAAVNHCAVTPDGQRVVSASSDRTLKVWDLMTGVVSTLEGHTAGVNHCAVTPDGRRVVSASGDRTLKVWDLATYRCVATHRGDTDFTAVTTTATTICAGDAAGTVWFLDGPRSLQPPSPGLEPSLAPSMSSSVMSSQRPTLRAPRHVILFLAANPSDTSRLALDDECAAVERELRMTAHRDDFEFRSKWAVTVDDLARHLMELEPTILHFSGHGTRGAPGELVAASASTRHRDLVVPGMGGGVGSIHLHDDHDGSQVVTARALAMMIRSAAPSARVLVLNACYTDAQADELCTAIDCVVGMTGAIEDAAARSFAVAFYRALGNRRSVKNAVDHAVATLAAKRLPDEHLPRCRTRDGIDAGQLVLGAPM